MKLTLFTLPKPNTTKHLQIIQSNALKSWQSLGSGVEIIVLGSGKGIKELAANCGAKYLPHIKTNKYGTPLLDDAFARARRHAKAPYLMYSNADMIYGPDLLEVVAHLPKYNFLAVGDRWDMDITKSLRYTSGWWKQLNQVKDLSGIRHAPVGSDYFIYPRDSFQNIPAFAVGRIKWDNWMIYEARRSGLRTIDCSNVVTAIHQNHDYTHQLNQGKNYLNNPEARYNEKLAAVVWRQYTLRDANWQFSGGIIVRKRYTPYQHFMTVKDTLYGIVERLRKTI